MSAKIYLLILIPVLGLIALATWILLERRAEVVEASETLSAQVAR
jgi:hypothetical protein